jgi:NADPH-dependent 2,4-dienoyl-CoA reductase/sulfur reductase-like enzyme
MSNEAIRADGAVVIVGASLGGLRTAEALRRDGFEGSITLVGAETHPPYDRPPLSKQMLSGAWEREQVVLADSAKLADLKITAHLGQAATSLDVATRSVTLANGTTLSGDAIVIATGCALRRLPGTESMPHVHGVRTIDDADALKADFDELAPGARVVLIGAGFIGQEVASEAHRRAFDVTVLEGLDIPLSPIVGPKVGEMLLALLPPEVKLHTGVKVAGIEASEGVRAGVVSLESGERFEADLIVVGIGVTPNVSWLEGSGLRIENGIWCDERLFAADGILAIGDVANFAWTSGGHDEQLRIEHWQVAVDHASQASRSILEGDAAAPLDLLPYFWSDVWGKKIQVLGHPTGAHEATVVIEPDEMGRFLVIFADGETFSGVLGVSKPAQLMGYRALLAAGATIAEAKALGAERLASERN